MQQRHELAKARNAPAEPSLHATCASKSAGSLFSILTDNASAEGVLRDNRLDSVLHQDKRCLRDRQYYAESGSQREGQQAAA